ALRAGPLHGAARDAASGPAARGRARPAARRPGCAATDGASALAREREPGDRAARASDVGAVARRAGSVARHPEPAPRSRAPRGAAPHMARAMETMQATMTPATLATRIRPSDGDGGHYCGRASVPRGNVSDRPDVPVGARAEQRVAGPAPRRVRGVAERIVYG